MPTLVTSLDFMPLFITDPVAILLEATHATFLSPSYATRVTGMSFASS